MNNPLKFVSKTTKKTKKDSTQKIRFESIEDYLARGGVIEVYNSKGEHLYSDCAFDLKIKENKEKSLKKAA